MRGQWALVLLCLTLVCGLVLGSMFPDQNKSPIPQDTVNTQQEVKWPIQNVATIPEVIVEEVKLSARDFQQDQNAERKLDNDQDNAAAETISQKKIIVNSDQKLVGENITENSSVKEFLVTENVTKSSSETEVKELPLTN